MKPTISRLFLLGFSLILSSAYCQEQIQFKNFGAIKPFKRGKSYEITWTGGVSTDVLTFQLVKGGVKVSEWANVANTGQHELIIPKSLKPGKDYSIDVVNNAQVVGKSRCFPSEEEFLWRLNLSHWLLPELFY